MTKAAVAQKVADTAPVPELTKDEADVVDEASHKQILSEILNRWDQWPGRTAPSFTQLPAGWQTVLLSRYFQQGPGFLASAPGSVFVNQAAKGDWAAASATFNGYPNQGHLAQYKDRLTQEAKLLRAEIPSASTRPGPPAVTPAPASRP